MLRLGQNNLKLMIFILVCFFINANLSLALSLEYIEQLIINENYTTIIIELPQFAHQIDVWNNVYEDVTKATNLLGIETVTQAYSGKSISDVSETFGGYVYINTPDYSFAKIVLPKENYTNMTETFKSLGFKVENNMWMRYHLNDSRTAIGLPYTNWHGQTELTGEGRTIAIMDSGLDGNHQDFQDDAGNPPPNAKVIYWSDVGTGGQCCFDNNGHGTHVASVAAGTGANSSGKYKGVAPRARLAIWRVFFGTGPDTEFLARAIDDAVANVTPDVISVSIGSNRDDLMLLGELE